ncbi:helix-turn-helix transcriptional regulator [Reyranella sp. CPCC 100927]|uniref:helix-turn-helix transcriptional regulator n=1 Tax=Reyranella sp. CPCC 100927 TaxID=2599616 RepID=UPI0011B3D3EE|nr:helix-turn-helix transcriptional regulator [Reyranella sp. CPCC 100927]TWS97548.1 hypothetical protein FQU96_37045 [Reyranella sp. CPCC 100927]
MGGTDLTNLVGLIYASAYDVAAVPGVMLKVAEAFGGQSAAYSETDRRTGKIWRADVGLDEDFYRKNREASEQVNALLPPFKRLPAGAVVVEETVMPRREFLHTAFYQEWFRPQDIHWTMACKLEHTDRAMAALTVRRHGRRSAAFNVQSMDAMRRLAPHLRESIKLRHRLRQDRLEQGLNREIVDRAVSGLAIVDQDGHAVLLNPAAEAFLARDAGLRLRSGRLEADGKAGTLLRTRIHRATTRDRAPVGGSFAIHGDDGALPLIVSVVPMRGDDAPGSQQPRHALVVMGDAGAELGPVRTQLAEIFGLTPSEAAVTLALCRGDDLPAICATLGISMPTARTHLQRAFAKTGTRRQAALAALLQRNFGHFDLT